MLPGCECKRVCVHMRVFVSASSNPLQSYGMDTHASVYLTDSFTHPLTYSHSLFLTYFLGVQLPLHRYPRWTQARRQNRPFQVVQGIDNHAVTCSSCLLLWAVLDCIALYSIIVCCSALYYLLSPPYRCLLCTFTK
jgi:hypothetical protein